MQDLVVNRVTLKDKGPGGIDLYLSDVKILSMGIESELHLLDWLIDKHGVEIAKKEEYTDTEKEEYTDTEKEEYTDTEAE